MRKILSLNWNSNVQAKSKQMVLFLILLFNLVQGLDFFLYRSGIIRQIPKFASLLVFALLVFYTTSKLLGMKLNLKIIKVYLPFIVIIIYMILHTLLTAIVGNYILGASGLIEAFKNISLWMFYFLFSALLLTFLYYKIILLKDLIESYLKLSYVIVLTSLIYYFLIIFDIFNFDFGVFRAGNLIRLNFIFSEPAYYAFYLNSCMVLYLFGLKHFRYKKMPFQFFLLTLATLLTFSFAGILQLLIIYIVLFFKNVAIGALKIRNILFILCTILLVIIVLPPNLNVSVESKSLIFEFISSFYKRMQSIFSFEDVSTAVRLEINKANLMAWKDAFLFGYGLTNVDLTSYSKIFKYLSWFEFTPGQITNQGNFYLTISVQLGIFGVILFITAIFCLFYKVKGIWLKMLIVLIVLRLLSTGSFFLAQIWFDISIVAYKITNPKND
ncbi:MAG: O-antigen ligase family protein [Thermosipho sp. (in: Bacteria)]|nr:O-antigen ligase family protein [Thermosipho sp. (in: thermotogales)]